MNLNKQTNMIFLSGSQRIRRLGSVSNLVYFVLGSLCVVVVLGILTLRLRPNAVRGNVGQESVRIYCAAGVAKPVQRLIDEYNREFGTTVELVRTGGSGELAGQIRTEFEAGIERGADLYITADDFLLEKAHREGIVAERMPLAEQTAVIAVAADSTLPIGNMAELVERSGLRFGVASNRAAIGKIARKIAKREGLLEALESRKTTDSENVMTLAQSLVTGSLQAGIIWDTTVSQINLASGNDGLKLKIAAYADKENQWRSNIAIGVLERCSSPAAGLRFARYLTAPETGQEAFEDFGFKFIPGDHWEEIPEIHVYCGSMFTPVLEPTLREFANREGINIYPRWEGCGKLVASMKATEDPGLFPDAYLACDRMFLDEVRDYFKVPIVLTNNRIVMAVRRDLKNRPSTPNDLLNGQLRIGLCDPVQSALGKLTQMLLTTSPYEGLYPKLHQSAAVVVDVGPTLISQLAAGGLDVAFVYRSNVMADPASKEKLVLVELDGESQYSIATQPWAIAKSTRHPNVLNRLFLRINREDIRHRFRDFGFKWVDTP